MDVSYMFLSSTPSTFTGKDGNTVSGFNVALLERVIYPDSRPAWRVIKCWRKSDPCLSFGEACMCTFNSFGKVQELFALSSDR